MGGLAMQIRGWTLSEDPELVLRDAFDEPGARRPFASAALAQGALAAPAHHDAPIGAVSCILVIRPRAAVRIHFAPGSQGLPCPPRGSPCWIEQPCEPGQAFLLDARLWVRISSPEAVDCELVSASTQVIPDAGLTDGRIATSGYVFLRGGLSHERVRSLTDALDAALASDETEWTLEHLLRIRQHGAIRNLVDLDQAFVSLLLETPVTALLEAVMAPGYILHSFDGLVLPPGDGRHPWDYHTDLEPLVGAAFSRGRRCLALNVLYYLDDVSVANGATWLVPSSHLSVARGFQRELLATLAVPAIGSGGDVLVFDARLWHCAGTNTTNSPRRLIKALYCEPWIQPQMDYVRATRSAVWNALPQSVRRLLGEGSAPPASTAELRARLSPDVN